MLSTLELNRRNEFNLHFDMEVKNNKMFDPIGPSMISSIINRYMSQKIIFSNCCNRNNYKFSKRVSHVKIKNPKSYKFL